MSCRVLRLCRVKQRRIIHNNYCEYVNSYFITPWLIKINSTSAKMDGWMGGETNVCIAASKLMDLNDLLIHSNALNIRLSRNLITREPFLWIQMNKNDNYFLIPTSNENNLIYLFITQTPEGEIKQSFCSRWVACT